MANKLEPNSQTQQESVVDHGRRRFLNLIPIGIFAGIAGTLAVAAYRFLRPASASAQEPRWVDALPMADIKGGKPVMCAITTQHVAGWSTTIEEQQIFILPGKVRTALSSACPHEGCNVIWRDETNDFFCPCHDSFFAPDGTRVSGPARRGLYPLPSRVKDGMLQVQYHSYVTNKEEPLPRV